MKEFKALFIKIGQFDHLKSLQLEGVIHCNTLQYFANLKDEQGKGDQLENVTEITYYEKAEMQLLFENGKILSFDISGSRKYKRITSPCGNLFCLYTVNFEEMPFNQVQKFTIDARLGTHALIINSGPFIERLNIALNRLNYDFSTDFVEYIDFSKFSGKKTFFQKDISFALQKEFRILINHPKNEFLQIRIGNIEEISNLIPIEELTKMSMIKADKNLQENIKLLSTK